MVDYKYGESPLKAALPFVKTIREAEMMVLDLILYGHAFCNRDGERALPGDVKREPGLTAVLQDGSIWRWESDEKSERLA